MDGRWNGHTVVVTGSSSGIGRETALRFAAGGACVVLHGRNKEKLNAVAARVREIAGDTDAEADRRFAGEHGAGREEAHPG
ncbi:MAG: SDR family NAD(P)-dependent oxidoreductase, partial [Spirochaetales bacterium]